MVLIHVDPQSVMITAPLKCSRYKDGLSSSKTGLGELITKLGDTMHKLSLPIGQYKYQVIQAGDNCTTFVRISGGSGENRYGNL